MVQGGVMDLRAELGPAMALARLLTDSEDAARLVVERAFTDAVTEAKGGVPPRLQSVVRECLTLLEQHPGPDLELPEYLEDGHHARHPATWESPGDDPEVAAFVRGCVSRLPARERIVFLLRDIQGMGRDDLACCLGWDRDQVSGVLHRARQALRGYLDRRLGTGVT
jgi:DNA-directed RNA polymerase specialized sigma24 family protein